MKLNSNYIYISNVCLDDAPLFLEEEAFKIIYTKLELLDDHDVTTHMSIFFSLLLSSV